MHSVKRQYFISFAVIGSLIPILSVYLDEQGLTRPEVGYLFALAAAAVIITPVLMTYLADAHLDHRKLIALIYIFSGFALTGVWWARGFWPILVSYSIYSLSFVPMLPLQDGYNFSVQAQRQRCGHEAVPYHIIRVWGTIGFIVPSLALYGLIRAGFSTGAAVATAVVCCALGLINTLTLPDSRPDRSKAKPQNTEGDKPIPPAPASSAEPNPTFEALRIMCKPPLLIFCIGMSLAYMATGAYYIFYPMYLVKAVGVNTEWLGLIATIGVILEIPLLLGFGWMLEWLGIRRLLILGLTCVALRLVLLAASDHIAIAVGTQLIHGMSVVAMHVVPPILLNRMAEDRYRSSIQGLYTMLVSGPSRILGALLAGYVGAVGFSWLFGCGAVLGGLAMVLFVLALRVEHKPAELPAELSVDQAAELESPDVLQVPPDATESPEAVKFEAAP